MNATVTITTKAKKTKDGRTLKSRSFHATLLSYIKADALWAGGQAKTDNVRPVWARFAGSPEMLRAFVANLRVGHLAEWTSGQGYAQKLIARFEFQKSVGYEVTHQSSEHGQVVTVAMPTLLSYEPGIIDPDAMRFVLITPHWWIAEQGIPPDLAQAVRFHTYVRNRTRRPIIPDRDFALLLLRRALEHKIAVSDSRDDGLAARGVDDDMLPPLFVNVAQSDFDTFLADTVQEYFADSAKQRAA
jgi:hypothetical protein